MMELIGIFAAVLAALLVHDAVRPLGRWLVVRTLEWFVERHRRQYMRDRRMWSATWSRASRIQSQLGLRSRQ